MSAATGSSAELSVGPADVEKQRMSHRTHWDSIASRVMSVRPETIRSLVTALSATSKAKMIRYLSYYQALSWRAIAEVLYMPGSSVLEDSETDSK